MHGADAAAVSALVTRAARQLALRAALEGAIAGILAATALALAGWPARDAFFTPLGAAITAVVLGAATRLALARPAPAAAARAIERAVPSSRNVILTAFELHEAGVAAAMGASDGPRPLAAYVQRVVHARAAAAAAGLDPARLFPVRGRIGVALAAWSMWALVVARATGGHVASRPLSVEAVIDRVDATVIPPVYTGRAAVHVRNPDRIEALAGSEVVLRVRTNADSLVAMLADSTAAAVTRDAGGEFDVRLRPRESGFVALEALRRPAATGDRRLVALTVVPDAPPVPRIVAPARDAVLPDGHRALDIAIEATDDIALASLALRYTKASGSGERYTFVEGEVPLAVQRASATAWSASVHWALDSLALQPGDIVVYRAVATDGRPGAPPVESDAYIAEVAAPGSVAAGGFSLDPEDDRSALSQQMVVLKAERLLAARGRLPAAAFADSAADLAAEQRRVRAEFVFMMGGEVGDATDTSMTDLNEEAEAAGESDLLAGRELNAGRVALRRATRAMSLAARDLDRAEVATALDHAREAVKRLEEAFARNRILLRALSSREALDPERRLSGVLTDLARAPRRVPDAGTPAHVAALRDVLAAATAIGGAARPRTLSLLAERALRADPTLKAVQDAAAALSRAARLAARGDTAAVRRLVDDAAIALAATLRTSLPLERATDASSAVAGVRGRLVDLLRAGRGGRP
jgi:hypothetical protein